MGTDTQWERGWDRAKGEPQRQWENLGVIVIPAGNVDRGTLCPEGMPLAQIPVFWPLSPAPAHELSEFQELNMNFTKQQSAKKC